MPGGDPPGGSACIAVQTSMEIVTHPKRREIPPLSGAPIAAARLVSFHTVSQTVVDLGKRFGARDFEVVQFLQRGR